MNKMYEPPPKDAFDPFLYYQCMREHHPVFWNAERAGWDLFRYDDVVYALNASHAFSSQIAPPSPEVSELKPRRLIEIFQRSQL